MVLHTWGQNLGQHIHVHCIVTDGALSPDRECWLTPVRCGFLFPTAALSKVFRGKYLDSLSAAHRSGELRMPGDDGLDDTRAFESLRTSLTIRRPRWSARSCRAASTTTTTRSTSTTRPSSSFPPPVPAETAERVRDLAVAAFQAVDARGLARVDFFVERGGERRVWVNELNTMPGFTPISMYPKLWAASGISYSELIDRLIQLAIAEHRDRRDVRAVL